MTGITANRPSMLVCAVAALCCLIAAGPSFAQDIRTYYTVQHPEQFEIDWTGFYEQANRRTAELRTRLTNHRDLAYGADRKQNLDLYLPTEPAAGAAVFLFLHGGGFQEGDRAQYGFVAESFAQHGIITAIASYRLANGGHHYPAQAEDVRSAVAWLYRNIESYGGDRHSIYVGGHSAGAILAAEVGTDRSWMAELGIPEYSLKGIAPVSGVFDFRADDRPGYVDAYAPTPELRQAASPIARVENPAPHAVVATGSAETSIIASSGALASALSDSNVQVELLVLQNENHQDTVLSLAAETDPLFRAILAMVNRAQATP